MIKKWKSWSDLLMLLCMCCIWNNWHYYGKRRWRHSSHRRQQKGESLKPWCRWTKCYMLSYTLIHILIWPVQSSLCTHTYPLTCPLLSPCISFSHSSYLCPALPMTHAAIGGWVFSKGSRRVHETESRVGICTRNTGDWVEHTQSLGILLITALFIYMHPADLLVYIL